MKTLLTFLLTVSTAFSAEQADIVVVAATPSGVAAAVAAARSGANVILLEKKNHVGGIVSGGLTNTDIYKKAAVGGLFAEFVKRVVPVACSASHVGYQTIRMEPVFMALGEACGIAAKAAADAKVEVRAVNVPAVQKEIIERGGVILYEAQPLVPETLKP